MGATQVCGPASPEALEILDRLVALSGGLHHLLAEVAARYDLTPQQAVLLRSLKQPRPMRTVAHAMRCDPSNVTGLIDRIERRGLVERIPDPADRRVRFLSLTDAGRRVREDIQRDLTEAAVLQWLTPSELGEFLGLLRRITTTGTFACAEGAVGCDFTPPLGDGPAGDDVVDKAPDSTSG